MASNGYTPGPWHAKGLHVYTGNDPENRDAAITQGGCGCCNSWDEGVNTEADAYLIAAAPELLEALADLTRLIDTYPSYFSAGEVNMAQYIEQAKAALKKARP